MLIVEIITFLFVGAFAGLLSGMIGIGGGVVFVPFQILIYQMVGVPLFLQMKLAIGTSLLATACTTFASARAHARHNAVAWDLIYKIGVGIISGALMGAFFARVVPGNVLEIIFGAVLVLLGIYLFFFVKLQDHETGRIPNFALFNLVGVGLGTTSAMLGVSGGFMTVPILLFFHIPIRRAIGTATAIGFLLSSVGALAFLFPNLEGVSYKYAIGYLYMPAFVSLSIGAMITSKWGAHLAHSLPIPLLKKVFSVILVIVGILMMMK